MQRGEEACHQSGARIEECPLRSRETEVGRVDVYQGHGLKRARSTVVGGFTCAAVTAAPSQSSGALR